MGSGIKVWDITGIDCNKGSPNYRDRAKRGRWKYTYLVSSNLSSIQMDGGGISVQIRTQNPPKSSKELFMIGYARFKVEEN